MAENVKTNTRGDGSIDPDFLRRFARECAADKTKATDITSRMGQKIKDAADQKNLNPQVFKLAMRLGRMEEMKRKTFLEDLDNYIHILELDKFTADMFEEEEDEAEGDAEADASAVPGTSASTPQEAAPVH